MRSYLGSGGADCHDLLLAGMIMLIRSWRLSAEMGHSCQLGLRTPPSIAVDCACRSAVINELRFGSGPPAPMRRYLIVEGRKR